MGFAFLAKFFDDEPYYQRALHFLQVLEEYAVPKSRGLLLGYPFNWETVRGTIRKGRSVITTVPYVYEAFRNVYRIDDDDR